MNHQFSEAEQAEIDAAWEAHKAEEHAKVEADWAEYDAEIERKAEEAMLSQMCPCGHTGAQHEGDYCTDWCTVEGCDCPRFGESPENYETYTKVYLGDPGDNMGLVAYE